MGTANLRNRAILIAVATFVAVQLAIAIPYARWTMLDVSLEWAFEYVAAWPWLGGGIAVTAVALLVPFYVNWSSVAPNSFEYASGAAAGFFGWFLMYPGPESIGRPSDSVGIWTLALLCGATGMGSWLIGRFIIDAAEKSKETRDGSASG